MTDTVFYNRTSLDQNRIERDKIETIRNALNDIY